MNILFLENSPRWIYGLPNGFKDIGHCVKVLDLIDKKNILDILSEFKPNLIMSIGWKSRHDIKIIQSLQRYLKSHNIPFIYWATEDPGYSRLFTLPFIQRTNPDFVFTICYEKVEYYKKLGIKSAYLDFGYHKSIHCPVKCEDKYKSPIAIVANAYPELLKKYPESFRLKSLKTLVSPILKNNIPIAFWGNDWDKMNSLLECEIPNECIRGYIPYPEANKVYSSASIVIGIQNQRNRPQLCQRTYEILGSGGFLLTSDTPRVRKLFTNKRDLVLSSSPNETIELIEYYLKNPYEREKIKANGKKAITKYSYKYRAKYIIDVLNKRNIIT